MRARDSFNLVALAAGGLLVLSTSGCLATHKYVQTQAVAPLQGKVDALNKKTDDIDRHVTEVDREAEQGYSKATAQAEQADKDAKTADQNAQAADQKAQGAQQTADKGVSLASNAQQEIDNIDNYQPVKTESVLFGFNRADLTKADQEQLGDLSQTIGSLKHYAVVVEGYTDHVGPKDYNLQLSQRRADTVVRYLTENEHVPLVKIHVMGFGEDQPAADNHTSAGRKQNRRVEVKIMAPDLGQQAEGARAAAQ